MHDFPWVDVHKYVMFQGDENYKDLWNIFHCPWILIKEVLFD